jgi:hypothetical protein
VPPGMSDQLKPDSALNYTESGFKAASFLNWLATSKRRSIVQDLTNELTYKTYI